MFIRSDLTEHFAKSKKKSRIKSALWLRFAHFQDDTKKEGVTQRTITTTTRTKKIKKEENPNNEIFESREYLA